MITPTSSSRTVRFADFPTLTAALDFAAGRAIAPDALEPAYLRDKVALTLAEQGKK